jgi:hypothetical protein
LVEGLVKGRCFEFLSIKSRYCPGHARGGNTHDATNTRFSVMAKKHELHHFQLPREALLTKSWPIHCNIALGGRLDTFCTLSLLFFAYTASRPARCQAAPSQNLGCSIRIAASFILFRAIQFALQLSAVSASEDVQRSCVFLRTPASSCIPHCALIGLIGIASTES